MIHVIATIRAQDGKLDVLTDAFRKIVPAVLSKPGCIEYGLSVHLATDLAGQAAFDDQELIIVEKWSELAALKRHIADPAYRSSYAELWQWVSGASMQILKPID